MKCKNVKLFRRVKVKPFKHTNKKVAARTEHLIGKEVIVVDKCTNNDIVYVKEDLKDLAFYQIHRKDLKRIKA